MRTWTMPSWSIVLKPLGTNKPPRSILDYAVAQDRWECPKAGRLLRQRCLPALVEAAGDDDPLDLAGAFPDAVDAQLAEEALGHVLPHIAAAAEDLHRAVGHPVRHLRGIEL